MNREIAEDGAQRRQDEEMTPPGLQQASSLSSRMSPRMAWGLAVAMCLVGGSVVASSILADDGRMEAPRWVVSAAGTAFLLAGLAIIKSYVLDRGLERPGDFWSPFLGTLICCCFAGITGWIAFGAGERGFRVSGSPLFLCLPGSASSS